jgi:hypothetical protein
MKTVIILYLPGHAGNFIARLFSLGNETMPLLQQHMLQHHLETVTDIPDDFDRLENYRFSTVPTRFDNWQQFHRSYADYKEYSCYNLLNIYCKQKYYRIVFPLHPHEFIADFNNQFESEFYYVDLDLNLWGNWVNEQQTKLNFQYRHNEQQQFEDLKAMHNMQPISLDKLLDSQQSFLTEYHRICKVMDIEPLTQQALLLRQDWMSVRLKTEKIHIISRPPNDDFTYDLFLDLVKSYPDSSEAYYIWSSPPKTLRTFLKHTPFSSSTVIIGIKDLLEGWDFEQFNWWQNPNLTIVSLIRDMVKQHADKTFILFVSLEQLDISLNEPNLHIIPWGGDWINQRAGYSKLNPVLDKNFNSKKHFINLNRHTRDHRIVTLSYLFGSGIAKSGMITYLGGPNENKSTPLLDRIYWEFGPDHDEIKTKILAGFNQMRSVLNTPSDTFDIYHVYGGEQNDNIGNFKNRLRNLYQDSFVEIVSESSFTPNSFMLTEKTAHCFYGCNFPIILCGAGSVAHLRDLGLDMFDDVVDHAYDQIHNPFDRIVTAVESNRRLLTDLDYAKQSWTHCRSRFEQNVQVMRDIYSWYENRARQKFAETLELIG